MVDGLGPGVVGGVVDAPLGHEPLNRSGSRSIIGSIPACSMIASRSGIRGQGGVRSSSVPAASPAAATTRSVSSIPSR